jgi:RNA polymerase sigma-70 factor (ECF subfamily)
MDAVNQAYLEIRDGDESGYLVIITETLGLLRKIYNLRLRNIVTFDEWESEALDVLIRAVRQFDPEAKTKFTTYYYQSLNNKSIDLLRKEMRRREREKNVISFSSANNIDLDIVDSSSHKQYALLDIVDAFKNIEISTPLRKAAFADIFGTRELDQKQFDKYAVVRVQKKMYTEVRKYLQNYDNLDEAS